MLKTFIYQTRQGLRDVCLCPIPRPGGQEAGHAASPNPVVDAPSQGTLGNYSSRSPTPALKSPVSSEDHLIRFQIVFAFAARSYSCESRVSHEAENLDLKGIPSHQALAEWIRRDNLGRFQRTAFAQPRAKSNPFGQLLLYRVVPATL
jgi:hypothetical protein